jgi:pimeloyl-ACP methyl ester carboxylesterase
MNVVRMLITTWLQVLWITLFLIIGGLPFSTLAAGPSNTDQRVVVEQTAFRVGGHLIAGDRGKLLVKENRQSAESRDIEIAFVRFRDRDAGDSPPIVYLPGGPGQPALETPENFAATYMNYLNLGGRGDMLVVEQRGIGQSRPRLDCPGLLSRPVDIPLSAKFMGTTHQRYIERCLDHWVRQGVDLSGYNVVSMADDIDELRAELGYEKIKLIGESFGAHHALAVIQAHGDRVERAALSAVIGPDDMFELPALVERQLAETERWSGDDWEDMDIVSILTQLDGPIEVHVPTDSGGIKLQIGRYDLALATVTYARSTSFLKQMPSLYRRIVEGDLTWLAQWSARMREGYPSNLASLLISCASGASAERRATIIEQAKESPLGDAVDLLGGDVCTPLNDIVFRERFREPVKADMPVLMMSGELDPRAPPVNAEKLLPNFLNGQHVVFPGVSHDFGDARQAQLELAYRFLARGESKPNPDLLPPF